MVYYNDKLLLLSKSTDYIELYRLMNNRIIRYNFNRMLHGPVEDTIARDVLKEFSATVDEKDTIYLIYQDMSLDLILLLLNNGNKEVIKLTENPIKEIKYLNMLVYKEELHIFYFVSVSERDREYRLYHHRFKGNDWDSNVLDTIEVRQLLNPMKVFKTDNTLALSYYHGRDDEQIYIRFFNQEEGKWQDKIRLTDNQEDKLYVDFILIDQLLHISYCQYEEGNLAVRYERFICEDGSVRRDKSQTLSNPENPQEPTILYYDKKLWISWIEYENVMSRYSKDMGKNWSPIYLWKETKGIDIVRYEYHKASSDETILKHSFGRIRPDIGFVGFGSTDNTFEIPFKKKVSIQDSPEYDRALDTDIKKLYNLIEGLDSRLAYIEDMVHEGNMETVIEAIDYIEEFLNRGTRGLYKRSKPK